MPDSPTPLVPRGVKGLGVAWWPISRAGTSTAVGIGVVHERGREQLARGVVGDALVERRADALGDGAVEVGLREQGVDDDAGVLDEEPAQQAHEARLGVDLHDAGGHAVGPGGVGAEAALLLGLVVDVADAPVARGLQTRLHALGRGSEGMAVDGVHGRAVGDAPIRLAGHADPALGVLERVRCGAQEGSPPRRPAWRAARAPPRAPRSRRS